MRKEKIFLTGGTSGVGSIVAQFLAARGSALRCLLHNAANRERLPRSAEIVLGDAEDSEALARAMAGAEACLHLAHVRFAARAVDACKAAGVGRLICLSSTRRFTRFTCESSRAVIAGETAVEASGLNWTILRPAMIYGIGTENNVARLIRWFRRCPVFPLVRSGQSLVQPVFAGDVAGAIVAALDRPETAGRSFNLAGPDALTYRRLAQVAARAAGRRAIFAPTPYPLVLCAAWIAEILSPRLGITRDTARRLLEDKAFDIAEARTALGFNPVSLEEGLRRIVQE